MGLREQREGRYRGGFRMPAIPNLTTAARADVRKPLGKEPAGGRAPGTAQRYEDLVSPGNGGRTISASMRFCRDRFRGYSLSRTLAWPELSLPGLAEAAGCDCVKRNRAACSASMRSRRLRSAPGGIMARSWRVHFTSSASTSSKAGPSAILHFLALRGRPTRD
jgi:hypothetical protein